MPQIPVVTHLPLERASRDPLDPMAGSVDEADRVLFLTIMAER